MQFQEGWRGGFENSNKEYNLKYGETTSGYSGEENFIKKALKNCEN